MAVKHETKTVELAKLVPYEKNPNVHPIEQIKAIADSIERYGQYYPIIVDEDMRILCGHGKKLALEHLGRKEGEVKILRGLTDKQKLKIVIEDNKIQSMSYVDFTKIEDIIREVGEVDIIGFGVDYLDAIINENVKDNMGVDFTQPVERKSNEKQVADIPQEVREEQDEEREDIESGMQTARTMLCPHCGKEIYI
ncbi:MAG: ParB N-terminal domain-containing protein [Muribaculaceae bacterium]|nr:ParB N-terminal domain-containing protein [Muribaculaceae bacterium]MBR4887497.1 ParB N-terminal domain-containing protein [Muribaculaceae bacterium]